MLWLVCHTGCAGVTLLLMQKKNRKRKSNTYVGSCLTVLFRQQKKRESWTYLEHRSVCETLCALVIASRAWYQILILCLPQHVKGEVWSTLDLASCKGTAWAQEKWDWRQAAISNRSCTYYLRINCVHQGDVWLLYPWCRHFTNAFSTPKTLWEKVEEIWPARAKELHPVFKRSPEGWHWYVPVCSHIFQVWRLFLDELKDFTKTVQPPL